MNALLAFIPKPVMAGAIIVLALSLTWQTWRVNSLVKENAKYEVAVEQCAKTNAKNKDVVAFLQLQQDRCLAGRQADETNLANQVAAWNVEKALLKEKADNVKAQSIEVYRDPSCAELAQLDITNVCPDFVDGLRKRSENYNGIRNN